MEKSWHIQDSYMFGETWYVYLKYLSFIWTLENCSVPIFLHIVFLSLFLSDFEMWRGGVRNQCSYKISQRLRNWDLAISVLTPEWEQEIRKWYLRADSSKKESWEILQFAFSSLDVRICISIPHAFNSYFITVFFTVALETEETW